LAERLPRSSVNIDTFGEEERTHLRLARSRLKAIYKMLKLLNLAEFHFNVKYL
jgi:hypothetical protein